MRRIIATTLLVILAISPPMSGEDPHTNQDALPSDWFAWAYQASQANPECYVKFRDCDRVIYVPTQEAVDIFLERLIGCTTHCPPNTEPHVYLETRSFICPEESVLVNPDPETIDQDLVFLCESKVDECDVYVRHSLPNVRPPRDEWPWCHRWTCAENCE
jgi:hypothetical protein